MSETNYVPNPASPVELNNDFLLDNAPGGRRRAATIRNSTEFLGVSKIYSATLINNTGADLYAILVDGPAPAGGTLFQDYDNIFQIIQAGDGELPAPYWGEPNGRDTDTGFSVVFLNSIAFDATRTVNEADPSASDVPSFLDISYDL